MKRYTRLFEDGEAYISFHHLRVSPQGTEICGEPIRRLALYEATGLEPAQVLGMARNICPSLAELNQKLMTFAEHAATEADRRLTQHGRAELPLGDMGHRFDLDVYDNKTLWDTAARMVAERLKEWDLDFDMDKNMLVLVDYDVQDIIEVCEKKIPFDPLVAPSDQQWGVRRVGGMGELLDNFEHGNWSARAGFVLDGLAFVQQIGGGDEWLSLKRDDHGWHSFDSISFGHMIKQSDVDYCRGHLEYLAAAPAHELIPPSEPTLTPTM